MNTTTSIKKALPVLFVFFIMGIADLVGISTSYIKKDFDLNDAIANLLPMSLFLWFAILSVPTGILMNRWGRKRMVLISMAISLLALFVPFVVYNFPVMLLVFSLLGIGNTIIQVSLNPLLTNVVSGDRLTSSLTLGQFIKAISSLLGPVIAGRAAIGFGDWKLVFLVYGVITILSGIWLMATPIAEEHPVQKKSSLKQTFSLLNDKVILMFFIGIIFVVGIDVGLNTTIPKLLMEKCNFPLERAGLGSSLYFLAKTIGSFAGAIILVKFSGKRFFYLSMLAALPALFIMLVFNNAWSILAMLFIVGLAVANVFSIIFSFALKRKPDHANEISGLMIMGVSGGAIILPIMGIVSDSLGQTGAMAVLLLLMVYLLYCSVQMKEETPVK